MRAEKALHTGGHALGGKDSNLNAQSQSPGPGCSFPVFSLAKPYFGHEGKTIKKIGDITKTMLVI